MGEVRSPFQSRVAVGFVVAGLILSATGWMYFVWAGRERSLPPITPNPDAHPTERLNAMMTTLLVTFFLFLAFLVGSYLMVRIGRLLLDRSTAPARTEYVDAWGSYRLTDEQIRAATLGMEPDYGANDEADGPEEDQPNPPAT